MAAVPSTFALTKSGMLTSLSKFFFPFQDSSILADSFQIGFFKLFFGWFFPLFFHDWLGYYHLILLNTRLCELVEVFLGSVLYNHATIQTYYYSISVALSHCYSLASFCTLAKAFATTILCSTHLSCVCFFLTEHLLLQTLLLALSINKLDHSLVKIKPYSFSLNLNRLGRMETSLTRRPLTIQATYRYSLCFSGFVMTTLSLREYSK